MKKIVLFIMIFFTVLSNTIPIYASTSFAVYSDKILYGMNFDFPETDMIFNVSEKDNIKTFSMVYFQTKSYVPTAALNEKGLFASWHMQYPAEPGKIKLGKDEMYIFDMGNLIRNTDSVDGVLKSVDNKRLVHQDYITLHELFADIKGNALIAEVGKDKNEYVPIDGNFIVMSDFKNSDFRNTAYNKIDGKGADRYQEVYKYILDNKQSFNIDKAFEGLKISMQEDGGYRTQCSMVFDPAEKNVYISLDQDINKLWKVSISDNTLETYKGFDKNIKINIPKTGVAAEYMKRGDYSKYQNGAEGEELTPPGSDRDLRDIANTKEEPTGIIAAVGIVLILGILIFAILNRKNKDENM